MLFLAVSPSLYYIRTPVPTCNVFGSLCGLRNSWFDKGALGFFGCDLFSTA